MDDKAFESLMETLSFITRLIFFTAFAVGFALTFM